MAKPKPCRSYEFTGNILDDNGEYKKFFKGLTEYLKGKLQRIEVKGGRYSYHQYTCGKLHDRRNSDWKPWKYLWEYCLEIGFDPYAARDAIEERIGVKLECECQIVNNENENRQKALANSFGADLGEPGKDFDFF
jgi:hypothetical protein